MKGHRALSRRQDRVRDTPLLPARLAARPMLDSTIDIDRLLRETFLARVEHHATIGSTNDRARHCAAEGRGPWPLLIAADMQTAGRGRGSNRWWTGQGSIACTLLLEPGKLGVQRPCWRLIGIAAALAVADVAAIRLSGHFVGLHWPNDVYAAGRKLAGILVEVFANRLHAIGIGLNANNSAADAPVELRQTAISLRDLTGTCFDRTDILVDLMQKIEQHLRQLAATPEAVTQRADAMCVQRGQELTLQVGGHLITGRCAGIGPDGALLLDMPSGRQKFYCGAVVPRLSAGCAEATGLDTR